MIRRHLKRSWPAAQLTEAEREAMRAYGVRPPGE
jgi:hypothetical protein